MFYDHLYVCSGDYRDLHVQPHPFPTRRSSDLTAVLGTLIYTSNQNTRTVIVPFGADGDLYVTGNKPSEAYLRSITFNIVGLAGTYSAYSADRQFQELLRIAHPSAYNGLRDRLNRLLDELGNNPTLSIAT